MFIALLFSCTSKKVDTARAYLFYDSVNTELNKNSYYRGLLIDTAQAMLSAIQENEDARFDTKPIRDLLEDMRAYSDIQRKNIEKITEIDKEINYKEKALISLKTFNDFFETEYEEFLKIIDDTSGDRFERSKKVLLSKLVMATGKGKELAEASRLFESKYPKDEQMTKKENNSELFSFKKLSELNFQMIKIPEGTEVSVFSYSGGNCSEIDNIYHQFIGIDQSTNDTIRVLTLCQSLDREISGEPRFGIFKEVTPFSNTGHTKESFVVFNARMEDLETRNYKTVVGMLDFE